MAAMTPSPWHGLVLALAVFRLLRLLSYDTFPPVARLRARVLGAKVSAHSRPVGEDEYVWTYDRPLLAELVHCPFCLGLWLAGAAYVLWIYLPAETMYGAVPFALSGAVGLIAKRLDP